MSYETLIFYSVVTSIITLDRVNLKKKVVDAPEILTVIDSIPNLTPFLNSLYGCQYGSFFQVTFLLVLHSWKDTCIPIFVQVLAPAMSPGLVMRLRHSVNLTYIVA